MKSRLISASLVLVMLLTLLPAAVMAEGAADGMTISVVSKSVNLTAKTVEVDVRIDGNDEGIVTMTVPVTWDNTQLKLTGVTANEEYGLTQLETAREISGWIGSTDYELAQERGVYYLAWDNDLASANHTGDGVLCTMTFDIIGTFAADDTAVITPVKEGENVLPIANVMNYDMDDLQNDVEFVAGTLSFAEKVRKLGDTNGDEKVNTQDALHLLYNIYFPNSYVIENDVVRDFNGDGKVNTQDALYLLYSIYFPNSYPLQ